MDIMWKSNHNRFVPKLGVYCLVIRKLILNAQLKKNSGGRCEVNILKNNGNEDFVKSTINTVLAVNDFFKWGNKNIILHEIAAQHKLPLYELSNIPDTRMANYTGKKYVRNASSIMQ